MIIFLIVTTVVWVIWTGSREDEPLIGCYITGLILAAAWGYYLG